MAKKLSKLCFQTVAQALQDQKVVIGTCEVLKNQEFAASSGWMTFSNQAYFLYMLNIY